MANEYCEKQKENGEDYGRLACVIAHFTLSPLSLHSNAQNLRKKRRRSIKIEDKSSSAIRMIKNLKFLCVYCGTTE
jgi:hypothetical protein